jgi:hypothetical protein
MYEPVEAKITFAELIDYIIPFSTNLTMQEHKYGRFNTEQLERNVALLLAALLLDEDGSYPCQEVTICIKWYKGGIDIVCEDGSSQLNDVLQTYVVVTLDNMVRFVDDLKRIQSRLLDVLDELDEQQDWAGPPMKLTVKYVLHQGVNRYDRMLVAPVIADQFNDLSTTKSNATIPTTIHISVGNEEDSVMTEHDSLTITRVVGIYYVNLDELETAGSSSGHNTDASLECPQVSNKTPPTRQAIPITAGHPMMSQQQKSPLWQMKSTRSSFAHWPPHLVSKTDVEANQMRLIKVTLQVRPISKSVTKFVHGVEWFFTAGWGNKRFESWWTHFSLELYFDNDEVYHLHRNDDGIWLTLKPEKHDPDSIPTISRMVDQMGDQQVTLSSIRNFQEWESHHAYSFMARNCKHFCYDFFHNFLMTDVGSLPQFKGVAESMWREASHEYGSKCSPIE